MKAGSIAGTSSGQTDRSDCFTWGFAKEFVTERQGRLVRYWVLMGLQLADRRNYHPVSAEQGQLVVIG